jgi:hypothetical protein
MRLRLAVLEHAEGAPRQTRDVLVLAVGHRHGDLHDLDVHCFGEPEALGHDGIDDAHATAGGDGAHLVLRDRLSDVELALEGRLRRPAHLPAVHEERHRHGRRPAASPARAAWSAHSRCRLLPATRS